MTATSPSRLLLPLCLLPLLAAAADGPEPMASGSGPAAGAGDAPAQEVRLRLDAEEGESVTYRYETRASITPPPQLGSATNVNTTMVVRRTAESVTPDSLRFRARIEDFYLEVSARDERTRAQLEDVAEQARRNAVGSRFWITVSPTGEMIRLRREHGEAVEGDRVEQALRHLSFADLPPGPVTVGQSWTGTDSLDAVSFGSPMPGTVVADVRTTLQSVDRSGARPVAVLRLEGTYELHQDSASAASGFTGEMEGTSDRTVRFDIEAGRFLSAEGTQDITVNLSLPGSGSGGFRVQTSVRHSVRLLEGG